MKLENSGERKWNIQIAKIQCYSYLNENSHKQR